MASLSTLLVDIRACSACADQLPCGPRPVLQVHEAARILVAGQAPGRKVHSSGIPFDDASGRRLRDWLGIDSETFYDPKQIAIVPMGFCYPGTGKSGDLPPRAECAALWREAILSRLRHEAKATGDAAIEALLTELETMPSLEPRRQPPVVSASPVVPLKLRTDAGELSFLSTTTVFGTPQDVTLSELAIEAFYPADAATRAALGR